MTEVPEHLLARSSKRRQEMTGEGVDAAPASDTSPAGAESAPAAAAPSAASSPVVPSPAPEVPPEPVKPWVEAANTRQKIPVWVAPVLVFLPVWFAIYWATLEPPASEAEGPLTIGAEVYSGPCAACHGDAGGGGVGPQLNDGEVLLTFPDWESQVAWIVNGSPAANGTPYGDADRPGGQRISSGGMPAFVDSLSSEELMAVVLYERVQHGGQDEAELAELEAAIEELEEGEIELEFASGQTAADIAALFVELDLAVEETAAGG